MNLLAKQISIKAGNKLICQSLTIHSKPGEVWGILGPNGCGKTTLLHALMGLHPIIHGEILLGKNKLKQLSLKCIAQSLGLLFQDFSTHFPQTVLDYCSASRYPHLPYFKKEDKQGKEIVLQALQTMELDLAQNKIIQHLSGGEQRRLAIAALLAQTPSIYLLDEPTNHLDIKHQIKVLTHFRYLAKNKSVTVLMTLHDINLVQQFCDHILLLFGDGTSMQGFTQATLNAQNLTRLYQHPILQKGEGEQSYWEAAHIC